MLYKGIELEIPKEKPSLTHSRSLDIITGKPSTQNMDWSGILSDIPWGRLKEALPDLYKDVCCLFTMMQMDYQICNGGIDQYFLNRYNEGFQPKDPSEGELYDFDEQKNTFSDYVKFAQEVFPERKAENQALLKACEAFQALEFEEDAECIDTIYCDEDEYIYDEDLDDDVPNPDYFEPYEEVYHEDVIHNDNGFDNIFYDANEYLEEIFEIHSQLYCKQLVIELNKPNDLDPVFVHAIMDGMPASALRKPSLDQLIQNAEEKAVVGSSGKGNEIETAHNF